MSTNSDRLIRLHELRKANADGHLFQHYKGERNLYRDLQTDVSTVRTSSHYERFTVVYPHVIHADGDRELCVGLNDNRVLVAVDEHARLFKPAIGVVYVSLTYGTLWFRTEEEFFADDVDVGGGVYKKRFQPISYEAVEERRNAR